MRNSNIRQRRCVPRDPHSAVLAQLDRGSAHSNAFAPYANCSDKCMNLGCELLEQRSQVFAGIPLPPGTARAVLQPRRRHGLPSTMPRMTLGKKSLREVNSFCSVSLMIKGREAGSIVRRVASARSAAIEKMKHRSRRSPRSDISVSRPSHLVFQSWQIYIAPSVRP